MSDDHTRYRLAEDAALRHEIRQPLERLDVIEGDTAGIEWVTFQCDEIASMCPITGQPDMNSITVRYRPNGRLIESKSLKLYLWGFRDRGIFVEELAQEIARRVDADSAPDDVEVTVRQSMRGGIVTTVTARAR